MWPGGEEDSGPAPGQVVPVGVEEPGPGPAADGEHQWDDEQDGAHHHVQTHRHQDNVVAEPEEKYLSDLNIIITEVLVWITSRHNLKVFHYFWSD